MDKIWRFLICSLLFIFCSTSECQSASVLERRFLSPSVEASTEELSNPEPPLDDLTSPDLYGDMTDEKPRYGTTYTKFPVPQRSATFTETQRHNIQATADALANFLDQRPTFKGQFQVTPQLKNDWASVKEQHKQERSRNYENEGQRTQDNDNGNIWTLFASRYAQKQETEPRTTQEETKEFQTVKRSPACLRKCIAQGFLHPAQCHSLC